jgi:N-glycosylase/DNA lyase
VTAREYYDVFEKYLALDRDYSAINADILSLSDNPTLKDAVSTSSGIRILKQDEWEAICSFIISQNNNIPRIKKIIASLSQRCGRKLDISHMEGHIAESHMENEGNFYSVPTADEILPLGVDGLFALKTGFRAKYIYDAVERIRDGELIIEDIFAERDTELAIEKLCTVKGIGRKVASCALLFGFKKYDAFPIDVWMKRVAERRFPELEELTPSTFGKYAGIAQQYLFYYERWNNNAINE